MSEQRVIAIGAAGVDIVGNLAKAANDSTSTPAEVWHSYGGVSRNVAENLARLGQPVSLITAVGADDFGGQLLHAAAAAGVDVSACLYTEEHHTGSYLAVIDPQGKAVIALDDMKVMQALTPEVLRDRADIIAAADLIFVDGNLSPAALKTVYQIARKARVPVCADPASRVLAGKLTRYLPQTYLVAGNGAEASVLCNQIIAVADRDTAQAAARCLVELGAEIAVISLAQVGVCYADMDESGFAPAIRTAVVHPTGAGDALTATVIFGLLNDIPLDESVRLGVSAASLTLQHPGAVLADLTLEKLYENLVV